MSAVTRLMHAANLATATLDEQDQINSPLDQHPFFVRTHWIFIELEFLALPSETAIFEQVKVARLQCDPTTAMMQVELLKKNTEQLPRGAVWHQRSKMCEWVEDCFKKEPK